MSAAGMVIERQSASLPVARADNRNSFGRFPIVPLALAMSAGIVADRFLKLDATIVAVSVALCLVTLFLSLRFSSKRASTMAVLVLCATAGTFYHHLVWWSVPRNDIGWQLQARPVLMKIRGRVAERPTVFPIRIDEPPTAIPQTDLTWFAIESEKIITPDRVIPVSGQIRVSVSGRVPGVVRGDSVTVLGEASGLPVPRNPGEFQIADSLKSQGLRGILRVNQPALVEVESRDANPVTATTDWLRSRCEAALKRSLSETSLSIAAALLLGDRSMITRNVRASFVESGTMHLLAISGLHIGILTGFLFACCRLCGWSDRRSVIFVLMLLAIYLGIADRRPPVIRACVLVSIWGVGKLLRRPSFSANSLAAAAVVVLALNPADLFDVGAQLSFLAVAAILWLIAVRRKIETGDVAADSDSSASNRILLPRWRQVLLPVQRWLWPAYLTTGTIWLLTMPLVAAAFHVVPLVGLVVNVLLIPFVAVALCIGLVSLILGVVHPLFATPVGLVFDALLQFLLSSVEASSNIAWGHFHVPSPPLWWLLGIYSFVAAAMLWNIWRRGSRWVWSGATLWILFGISVGAQPLDQTGLRCTFLSVGHGLSVLIETPSGRTLLYDAGSLANGQTATRAVENALWERGHRRIDALVISHADIDHYNGIAPLFETFPIRSIQYSPHFLDESQSGTIELRNLARQYGTLHSELAAGDLIKLDREMTVRVLQPKRELDYSSDNAGSLVLEIEYLSRRILLTGDLENEGLFELMNHPSRPVDILLAPHHGSLAANPKSLAEWCQPTWIVASSGRRFPGERLRTQYGEHGPRVLSTFEEGAIEFTISRDGQISRHGWRAPASAAEAN